MSVLGTLLKKGRLVLAMTTLLFVAGIVVLPGLDSTYAGRPDTQVNRKADEGPPNLTELSDVVEIKSLAAIPNADAAAGKAIRKDVFSRVGRGDCNRQLGRPVLNEPEMVHP